MDETTHDFTYLIRLGDTALIAGQRLGEWCGHGPILEEDIALTNTALDCIGQARLLLSEAANREGRGRTEDDLAFKRDVFEYTNLLITEQPNGDYAHTIAKHFLLSTYQFVLYRELLDSTDDFLKSFAEKSIKEVQYHVKHTRDWMLRLGDGTEESHRRMQTALDQMWVYTGEFFNDDSVDEAMHERGAAPLMRSLENEWLELVYQVIHAATLTVPEVARFQDGGRRGEHSEHLGFVLAEMQFLPRAYPDAKW